MGEKNRTERQTRLRAMKKLSVLFALALAALWGDFGGAGAAPGATTEVAMDAQTQAVVAAATAFLNSLSADQREKVLFSFTPQKTATAARFTRSGMNSGPGG